MIYYNLITLTFDDLKELTIFLIKFSSYRKKIEINYLPTAIYLANDKNV